MPLSKVLWTCLTGATILITMLLGSWGASVNAHQAQAESRDTTLENHYAVMDQRLMDIQERLAEIRKQLEETPNGH